MTYINLDKELLKKLDDLKKNTKFLSIKSEYTSKGYDNQKTRYLRSFTKKVNLIYD